MFWQEKRSFFYKNNRFFHCFHSGISRINSSIASGIFSFDIACSFTICFLSAFSKTSSKQSASSRFLNNAAKCPSPLTLYGKNRRQFFTSSLPLTVHSGLPSSIPSQIGSSCREKSAFCSKNTLRFVHPLP